MPTATFIQDGDRVRLQPAPVARPITADVVERACHVLGLDFDRVLAGDQDFGTVAAPPLSRGRAFLEVVLENAEAYDLWRMPLDYARATLEVVAANFTVRIGAKMGWRHGTSRLSAPGSTTTRPPGT